MSARNITRTGQASSCYFRTTAGDGTRKALVQIDEPYLVFAARTPQSRHDSGEFIVGNIFTDQDIAAPARRLPVRRTVRDGRQPHLPVLRHRRAVRQGLPRGGRRRGADRCRGHRGLPRHLRGATAAAANDRMTGQRGLFISIDGPGGSGKSTVAALVTARLARHGRMVRQTREPSPTPLGQLIRAGTDEYAGMALACLVAGDRHHHLAAEIRPALAAAQIIICDRYLPASLVLQRMDGHQLGRHPPAQPGRASMVLTVARRALPASVLPRLSRSRPPAMSRAAATRSRFALAVLRHTQSSSYDRPLP
jgi:hypothetical protein